MPTRRPSPEHQEAVSRRLALLSAELAGARPEAARDPEPDPEPGAWSGGHTRIRTARPGGVPGEPMSPPARPLAPAPPPVPVPGRHASRRAGHALTDAVPDTLRGRVALGPAQLSVVAVLVALGLAVTCWWVLRSDPQSLQAPGLEPTVATMVSQAPLGDASPAAAGASPGALSSASAAGTVTVDVAGKVRRPGIAVLDAGARVVDALKAAGGARRGADLSGLNLARLLVDGEQVVVGQPATVVGVAPAAVPTPGAPGGPLVDLNTASQTELEALPEVGPVTAQAILAWREEHGGFTSVDELLEVDGIGDATLAKLSPYVTV
jgi:competence protein ComEA